MTDVTTSEVEKLPPSCGPAETLDNKTLVEVALQSSYRLATFGNRVQHDRLNECRDELLRRPAAIQQDKDRAEEARPAQPAKVTDAMVQRAAIALFLTDAAAHEDEWREDENADLREVFRQAARAALAAALRLPDEQAGGGA